MKLSEIEHKYNFTYSELYKQLEQDGMLEIGEYGSNWYSTVYPKLKENPPLLLFTDDFELLNTKAVSEAIEELTDPDDYRQIKHEFKLIPFGQSGAGDYYCFFLNEKDGDDIPIVFVWHDSNESNYLAKNLQDFVFRILLTDMSEQDTYNSVSDEEFKNNLKSVLKTHTKYLTEKQIEILLNIYSREIIDYEIELPKGRKEKHRGLLTDIELKSILSDTIPYKKIDTSFEYSKD
ncbi:SMI1/KNR4 family protein [Chryseobacterium luquanense]|uniref:SMI1/KNR4 family protein n=1 Tax=Chryseobacterium luquanense TaxID=2983766 RepID=A0ABT3Y7W8_9FLAO|nr:SMI1/KNR4 family protein [Chryseobacterium luquanense]MCX8534264.1 SMI1/KNR4 family protein [Chryseobacterium luquanense]